MNYNNTKNAKYDNKHNATSMDIILENEKILNETEPWNKLDKLIKMQKLNTFAHVYGIKQGYDIEKLVFFFTDCLEKNKLKKKKDLIYDKDTFEIKSIPSLIFTNGIFTLADMDTKRKSTMKSLTPKRNG